MTLISEILKTSAAISNNRTEHVVLAHTMEEVGELAQEVNIHSGQLNKEPSVDGVFGEAVDAIITLVDLLHVHTNGKVTEEELIAYAQTKLQKWRSKHE